MIRLLFLLLALPALAQPNWLVTKWLANGVWQQKETDSHNQYVSCFVFPYYGYQTTNRIVISFLTTTNISGDFTGKSLTANFSIMSTLGTRFAYGGMLDVNGQQPGWNAGTLPANVRFFVSSYRDAYNNLYADYHPDFFFWSKEGTVSVNQGIYTLTASLDPSKWTNAAGQTNAVGFANAVKNVAQIGLSFGGGSFYDAGIGVLENTGSAWFALQNFDVQ